MFSNVRQLSRSVIRAAAVAFLVACGETPSAPKADDVSAVAELANSHGGSHTVYTSGSHVTAYGPIYQFYGEPTWTTNPCSVSGALALNDSRWGAGRAATAFGAGTHPWESSVGYFAPWINAWGNISSGGGPGFPGTAVNPSAHNWTKYETQVTGNGSFSLKLLADNCSWIYLDGTLVGYQDDSWNAASIAYGVTLNGTHKLTFVIFDGGGAAGGMYRMETSTTPPPPLNPDLDGDGHVNTADKFPLNPAEWADTDGDGHGDNGDAFPNDPSKWEFDPTITLQGIVRDFNDSHGDFEGFVGDDRGIVALQLGADGKPVYTGLAGNPSTSGQANFDQWYRNVAGVNMAKQVDLVLTRQPDGTYRYINNAYFPIDNELFGNQGRAHNYHFTTEIHTTFTYRGGETFSFTGDDDLFVFINGKLAIDLGGVHGAQTGHVALSTLGLTVGQSYPLDIFQAERQCCGSNFSITTTLQLVSEPPAPVDNTPPTVTPTVTGTLGANDWYTSNINISWAVNDAETSITSSTGCTASTVSTDTNGMTFTCTATSDGGTASASVTVKRDASAPTVAGTVSGTQGSNSWYTSDVGVSWAVADATSGVASSTGCSATTTATDNAGTTYTCTATDAAGNSTTKSVSAKRDGTAPAVAGTLSGTVGNNGWYTSDVTASWATTDAMSGIATGCATTSTTTDNAGTTYSCTATDAAGNSTSKTMSAKRDATNPALGFSGNAGTYYVHQNVNITCATSDAMSGLASSSCPGASGAAYTFAVGSNTLNASATDNAGNVSLGSASFNVVVRSGDICTLVQQWVANKGVANSFCKQLEHQQYEAFRNHMSAQSGKHITAERAAILIALSRSL